MISDNNLPHGWVTTFLGEIAEWGSGGTPSRRFKEYFEGDIPWIKTGELNQKYISDSEEKISRQAVEKSSAKIFPRGSVGIAMYGATIGKLAIWKIDASTNQACAVAKIDTNLLFNEFLYYFLVSEKSSLIKAGKGGAQPNISQGIIKSWEINLPPLSEQHRIVAKIEELFSEIDKGVESLKTAKAQLQVYRQALLKHAFEGKLTAQWRSNNPDKVVPAEELLRSIEQAREERYQQQLTDWQTAVEKWEFNGKEGKKPTKPTRPKYSKLLSLDNFEMYGVLPKNWIWAKICDVATVGTGGTPLKSRIDFYKDGIIPWVTSGALNNEFVRVPSGLVTQAALNENNLKLYPSHTLLVALYGEGKTRGKCSELLIEATTNQAIAAIVQSGIEEKIRPYLKLFFQMNYDNIRRKSSGGVQPNLNLGIIENTVFPLCSLAEQSEIVNLLQSKLSIISSLQNEFELKFAKAEALRQSILKKAFSGQLVPQDPNDEPASELLKRIQAEKAERETKTKRKSTK